MDCSVGLQPVLCPGPPPQPELGPFRAGTSGKFDAHIRPGTYFVFGLSPAVEGAGVPFGCTSGVVSARAGAKLDVTVICVAPAG